MVEYLLYGKIINELNAKQAIYILDSQNYQKNLEQFRKNFKNLESKKLQKVFEEALENLNIEECVKNSWNEYEKKRKNFRNNLNFYQFKAKITKSNKIDYEKLVFKSNRNHHLKHSDFIEKK